MLGVAYKKDIDDLRESPALKVIRLLREHGADVDYHDPYPTGSRVRPRVRSDLEEYRRVAGYDAVVIVTAHSALDYRTIVHEADLVVDSRNATSRITSAGNVWKLSGRPVS